MSGCLQTPQFSVQELKEESIPQIISRSEDEELANLYLKYDKEESKHKEFQESSFDEGSGDRKEKFDKWKVAAMNPKEDFSKDKNFDEFENDIKIVMESGTIKKETNTENTTAEELEVLTVDRNFHSQNGFQPETIQQEEVNVKSEEDEKEKLNKKTPGNQVVLRQCPECPYSTSHKGNFKLHLVKHKKRDEIDWYNCQDCLYKTYRKSDLMRHAEIHSSSVLKCPECCYETSRRANLNKHQKIHKTKYKSHSCPLCPYKTHNKPSLKMHCRRSHSCDVNNPKQTEIFKCTDCSYENGSKWNVKIHQLIHDQSNWLQCPCCTFKTPYKGSLKRHQVLHQGENSENWHRCPECPYKTRHKNDLPFHVISHKTADEIQWFECSQCSFRTAYKHYLKRHQLVHKEGHEIEWFYCYECSFKTKHKPNLVIHLSAHKKTKRQR